MADQLLSEQHSLFELRQKEVDPRWHNHLGMQIAIKLAASRRCVEAITTPSEISVVFAMYGETERMQRPSEHPHGEDFIRRKVEQLDWLLAGLPHLSWYLEIVDDGCPNGSGEMAQQIVAQMGLTKQIRIHKLADGIAANALVCEGMKDDSDSQKGGSIAYGLSLAAKRNRSDNHYVCFTDADLSTHLGQVGLLIEPIANGVADISCGSRREPHSVVLKQGTRNERGKLFIYLWRQLIPQLSFLVDTQCGFKAFRASVLAEVLFNRVENKFAFDIELLLKGELANPGRISKVAVGWIDSDALSTTTDIGPYLNMLKAIVIMYHNYLELNEKASGYASLISTMDEEGWQQMLTTLEPQLAKYTLTQVLQSNEFQPERLAESAQPTNRLRQTVKC
ncbi:hypothetical protein [uncultured Ferrimonas sp.]|uniref:hypothetical protein n=1 Tax=uncultured Ferrimonas sp. TaxID=432640 RepID=UPI002613521A|nr:hypothetical protein [uncultured Ferrimonas sp.]